MRKLAAEGPRLAALLGAAANPNLNIVYAGLTGLSEVAVFTYDDSGRLFLASEDPTPGDAIRYTSAGPPSRPTLASARASASRSERLISRA